MNFQGPLKRSQFVQALMPIYRIAVNLQTKLPLPGHYSRHLKQVDYVVKDTNPATQTKSLENSTRFKARLIKLLSYVEETGSKPVCVTQPHRFIKVIDGTPYCAADILGKGFSGLDFDISMRDLNKIILEVCGASKTIHLHDAISNSDPFYDGVHRNFRI